MNYLCQQKKDYSIGLIPSRACSSICPGLARDVLSPLLISTKRGIFQTLARGFWQKFRILSQIEDTRDQPTRKKPRTWGPFQPCVSQNRETGLTGWGSSAASTLLCPLSLLTGNLQGNFARSRVRERQRLVKCGVVTGLSMRIPYSTEQGIILAEQRIFGARKGNFYKSPPSEILFTKDDCGMSAFPPKADMCSAPRHVR